MIRDYADPQPARIIAPRAILYLRRVRLKRARPAPILSERLPLVMPEFFTTRQELNPDGPEGLEVWHEVD